MLGWKAQGVHSELERPKFYFARVEVEQKCLKPTCEYLGDQSLEAEVCVKLT